MVSECIVFFKSICVDIEEAKELLCVFHQNQNQNRGQGDPVVKGKKSKDAPGRPIKKIFLPLHRSAMSTGVGMPSIHGPSCNTPLILSPTLAPIARVVKLNDLFCWKPLVFFDEKKFELACREENFFGEESLAAA